MISKRFRIVCFGDSGGKWIATRRRTGLTDYLCYEGFKDVTGLSLVRGQGYYARLTVRAEPSPRARKPAGRHKVAGRGKTAGRRTSRA